MEYLQELILELNSNTAYTTVGAKQGDNNSRIIKVHLTQNGEDYTIPEGVSAYFRFRKPDGKAIVNVATIQDNSVYIVLTSQVLAAAGRGYGDITLQSGTQILSTVSFILIIMAAPQVADQVVSSNEFNYLNAVVADAISVIYEAEAWADGTRGGAPVASTNTFQPSFKPNSTIQNIEVTESTFMQKVGSTPGLQRTYTFTYTENNNWKLVTQTVNGASVSESEPELINNLNDYGIIVSYFGGVTQPNTGDWIKVFIQEADNTYQNNAKYYAELAEDSKEAIENLSVSAEGLEAGVPPEVVKTIVDDHINLNFKIPKGDIGPYGFDAVNATASNLLPNVQPTVVAALDTSSSTRTLSFAFGIPAADGTGAASVDNVPANGSRNVPLYALRYCSNDSATIMQLLTNVQKTQVCKNIGAILAPNANTDEFVYYTGAGWGASSIRQVPPPGTPGYVLSVDSGGDRYIWSPGPTAISNAEIDLIVDD